MRRLLLLCLLVSGCASSTPAPVVTPVQPIHVSYGINDGFHSPLPPDIVMHDCGYGKDLTIRTPQIAPADLLSFLVSIQPCGTLHTLLLVENPDTNLLVNLLPVALANHVPAIELGNELEIAPNNLTPAQYAAWIGEAFAVTQNMGYQGVLIMGGVYALTDETEQAITLALPSCPTCLVGVHLYEPLTDAQIAWLQGLHRPVAVTEFGSPTGCGPAQWPAQAAYWQAQNVSFARIPASYVIGYQRPSGAVGDCSNLATFGIETQGFWKPADAVLAGWVQQ